MADLNDRSNDVSIHNEDTDAPVTTTTDGSKERLDVAVQDDIETIGHYHDKIHSGDAYHVSDYGTYSKNAEWDILIKVGSTQMHLLWGVSANVGALVELFESPTVTANGTQYTIYNKKRASSNTPDTDVYETPTLTADGTQFEVAVLPGSNQSGILCSVDLEWVLKANTDYLFRITSQGNSNLLGLALDWYEENV